MIGRVTHRLDAQAVQVLLRGAVARDLLRRGYKVQREAQRRCPVDHGRLRSSITVGMFTRGGRPICRVGTNVAYATWVHNGTGLYGPRHQRIYPTHGRVMVFTPRMGAGGFISRGNRRTVFARSTRGMKGTPFLRDALPAFRP